MIAYLLCAGFGTRMRPLTKETPKSLLPVGNRPILDYLLEELRDWTALEAIHVATNHPHAEAFRAWATEWRSHLNPGDVELHLHDDGVTTPDNQLGAVGDLAFLLDETGLPTDGALVSGGDSLYRFPLAPILNAFDGSAPQLLALYEPNPAILRHRSVLDLDGTTVNGLEEEPVDPPSQRVCPSWYLLPPEALATVDRFLAQEGDPDTLGTFVDHVAGAHPVEALLFPKRPNLRVHCNTPDDLRRARTRLQEDPRCLLDTEDVQTVVGSGPT